VLIDGKSRMIHSMFVVAKACVLSCFVKCLLFWVLKTRLDVY
jgi:hypothetical protein